MKLLIKPEWRGVFKMYPIDFKQKEGVLTYYPSLSAISEKNLLFSIGSFDVLAKGKLFFVSAKADDADATNDGYGIAIAPVVTYSINETWSIGCTLNFAELGY